MTQSTDDTFALVRRRIIEPGGLFFFAKTLCGFPDLSVRGHLALCLLLEMFLKKELPQRSLLVEFPRKHLKTTIVTVASSLWLFAYRIITGQDPCDRIAYASSLKTNSMRFLRLSSSIIETRPVWHAFLPELLPNLNDEQVWNKDEIIFPRTRVYPEPSIDTIGAGSRSTSRHYSIIYEDDFINEENYDSPDAVKKAIEQHQLYENLIESTDDLRIVCQNSWGGADMNAHIIKNEPSTIVMSVDAEVGLNMERSRHVPHKIVEMCREWEDGQGVWIERFDRAALAKIREKVGPRIYNAQYKNKPFDPDVVDFRSEWLGRWEWGKKTLANGEEIRTIKLLRKDMPLKVWPLRDLHIVGAWDPSMGKKTDSDRSAFTVVGVTPDNEAVVLETLWSRTDPLDFMWEIFRVCVEWGVRRVAIEAVAFQKLLLPVIENTLFYRRQLAELRGDKKDLALQVAPGIFEEVKPMKGKDKQARIRYYLSVPGKEGRIYVHSNQLELLDEWEHFPEGATDDILDSFAYTVPMWAPGTTEEEEEVVARRVDLTLRSRDPVTGY